MKNIDYDSLNLLDLSALTSLLGYHSKAASVLEKPDERTLQRERMAKKRAIERDLAIPLPENPARRLLAESNQVLWLRTYFPESFYEDFTQDRKDMLESIENAALYGGDQAIAGPRGEGKTSLAMHGAFNLMVRRLCDFPVVIGKSQSKSQLELKDIKDKLQQSELFIADYPELGIPFRAVGGWSSRARMQTVGGRSTNLVLAADHIAFPLITREQLPADWPDEIIPASCGQVIYCLGIDGPIRGTKFRGRRPKLAIIDDIEDREAAASDSLIIKNEEVIEQDIAGLGSSAERVARAMLCTIQNRKCIAFKYTDPTQKPSFRGKRYRKMIKRPDRMDLVEQYVNMRRMRSELDDDAREAFRFWRDNQEAIEAGCVTSNPNSYSRKLHIDGESLELSSIHAYFNRVADWGEKAVATEIDNDPPEEVGPQGNGLTAQTIVRRIGDYGQGEAPETTRVRTVAIDLGNYKSHWVDVAWEGNAVGSIVDYGILKTFGLDARSDNKAIELALLDMLERWADEVVKDINPIICLIDSGSGKGHTAAVYEFCRRRGKPFFPSKGWATSRFRMPAAEPNSKVPFLETWAHNLVSDRVWLYNVHTEWWKPWVHSRFLTDPYLDDHTRNAGSLTLYDPNGVRNQHNLFANHVIAEEEQTLDGKTVWMQKSSENHYLDALALACAGAGSVGVRLIEQYRPEPKPQPERKPVDNDRFKKRPGGWIPRKR